MMYQKLLAFIGKKERIWFNCYSSQFDFSKMSLVKFNSVINGMRDQKSFGK